MFCQLDFCYELGKKSYLDLIGFIILFVVHVLVIFDILICSVAVFIRLASGDTSCA